MRFRPDRFWADRHAPVARVGAATIETRSPDGKGLMHINHAARRIGTVNPAPSFFSKGWVMMVTLQREQPPAAAPRAPGRETEQTFDAAFVALLPTVRGYARRLAKSNGDDIAPGTILRAWAARGSYTPGTNLRL